MPAAAQVRLQELQGRLWPSTQLAQKPARRENYIILIIYYYCYYYYFLSLLL